MNQNLKISQVILIFIVFGGLLFAKFWASTNSVSVKVFSYMHPHPDGSIYLKLNNQLYGFNQKGQHQKTIDLATMQVDKNNLTDFAFFSNGDLLIRQHAKENNFIENLRRYFRYTNQTDKISLITQDGLFRCSTTTSECTSFTHHSLNLHGTLGLTIDWSSDRVIVADTNRHSVYLFSENGEELDSLGKFQFPNQVRVVNNKLYVANTNHHKLSVFDLSDDTLDNPVLTESFDTRTDESRLLGETWPASFMITVNERWIINMKNGMSFGGVYIFDRQGEFIKKLQLPSGADPFELIQMGNQVLVSDFSLDRIFRYSLDGELLGDFKPTIFQEKLTKLIEKREYYDQLEKIFSLLFALSLITGFTLALYQQYKLKKLDTNTDEPLSLSSQEIEIEPILHWVKPSSKVEYVAGISIVFIIVALLLIFWILDPTPIEFFNHTWQIFLLIFITFISSLLRLRRKIGITENTVIIYPMIGSPNICLKSNIISNDEYIEMGNKLFKINQLYQIFSKQDFENHLYPAIKQGRQVDDLQMQELVSRNKIIQITRISIAIILLTLFLYFGVFNK